ncbi:MAG: hypothetical protein WBL61_05720 [Bryobacteraceae bacterium]
MDAAFAAIKKTAIVLSLALLAAMPRLANAATPAFTYPTPTTVVTLSSGGGSVTVTGSQDSASPAAPISFTVFVTYASGDPHWLSVGGDTGNPFSGCTGGGFDYTTPYTLTMGLGCSAASLASGIHTATVTLTPYAPTGGVQSVTFQVTYNTSGGVSPTLVASPSTLSGSNAMTAPVGGQVATTVSLSTTGSSLIAFGTTTGAAWLQVSPVSGSVTNTAPASLTFTASAVGLAAGQYNTTATVSYGSSQTLIVTVTFNVTSSAVVFSPTAVAWTYANGVLSPTSATQTVSLVTPNNDAYSAAVSYPGGAAATNWLQVNGSTSATGLTNGSTFSVGLANYAALATGTYTGTITVTDTVNPSTSAALTVTLTVSGSSGGLTVSPSPVSLSSSNGYNQVVTVTSSAGGAFTATASSSNGWLGVTPSATSIVAGGQAYLTVTANTSVTGSGTFTGTIAIQVGSASQTLIVYLTAGSGAGGVANGAMAPTSLNFVAQSGASAVMQEIVFVGNSGTFEISTQPNYGSGSQAWLISSTISGNLSTTGTTVKIFAYPETLLPGTYTASVPISIVANGVAVNPSPTLQVTFVVTAGEVLSASPSTVILDTAGTTQTATIQVSTTGSTALPLTVTPSSTGNWLTATLEGSTDTTPATISLTANPTGLSAGLYAGFVTVTGGTTPALSVPVVFVVTQSSNPTGLTLSAPSLTFAAQVGSSAPSSQSLTVSSNPAGTAFSAVVNITSPTGGNWLSITPSGSLTTNATLTVSVNQSGLAPGTYGANISLTANGASQSVPVNLVVSSTGITGGNIVVSASALGFSAVSGGSAPAPQTLTVSSAAGSAGVPFTVAASSTGNWLSVTPLSGTTQATLTVSVNQANLSIGNHSGNITITPTGGTAVVVSVTVDVVSQPTISVSPGMLSFDFQAGSGGTVSPGQLTVTAAGGTASFQASASSTGNWLSVTPTSGTTSASTILTVQVNPAGLAANTTYPGTITINGVNGSEGSVVVDVSLSVTTPLPVITSVLNAASFLSGPVSPGEIVSIFGTEIGPLNPATLTLDSTGKVSTSIGGVKVSFSGYLAPLTYVSATQINAVVPYELAGNKEPFVEVEFAGQTSNEPSLQLAASAPGIFATNGTGPGAILNFDGSVNTQGHPAAKGSTIVLFVTGEGLTTPAQATGAVTPVNLSGVGPLTPAPQLAVSVLIGNQPAYVAFAGEAPYFVAGVMQVNAVIPATVVGDGAIPVTVQVGKQISQSGVTVWVQ